MNDGSSELFHAPSQDQRRASVEACFVADDDDSEAAIQSRTEGDGRGPAEHGGYIAAPIAAAGDNSGHNEEEPHSVKDALIKHGRIILIPLTDQTGSAEHVAAGIGVLFAFGTLLGVAMPKDPHLPTPWYRHVSSVLGYTYFLSWSISFYPQILLNYRRGSTAGLSSDFCAVNVLGFACYAGYMSAFYWSSGVKDLYAERNGEGSETTVQSNDVAFAMHALALSLVWLGQLFWYGGFRERPLSSAVLVAICVTWTVCLAVAGLISAGYSGEYTWLDYLYLLSFVKVTVTVTKYIPQALLNMRRKSTVGWNIWTILTDFTGGMLSLLQLVLDSVDMGDWTGITGNSAKLGLSMISIGFDVVFLLQHYVLYPHSASSSEEEAGSETLLEMQNQIVGSPGDAEVEVS